MSREEKSQVDDLTKLRKILDHSSDPNFKIFLSKEEKILDSIRRRLSGETIKTQPRSYNFSRWSGSLEPRVSVHAKATVSPRPIIPFPKHEPSTTLPEFELVSASAPTKLIHSQELLSPTEELFEVEKVEVSFPEFLEITPKETLQISPETDTVMTPDQTTIDTSDLPEWQPIQEEQSTRQPLSYEEQVMDYNPGFERMDISATPEIIKTSTEERILPIKDATNEIPVEFISVQPPESPLQTLSKKQQRDTKKAQKKKEREIKKLKKLEQKKLKKEKREETRLIKEQSPVQQTQGEKLSKSGSIGDIEASQIKVDLNTFEGIASVDNEIAELLYKNGYFSVENLNDATVDDLVQIRGIKRTLAKQIKKEVEQKIRTIVTPEFVPAKHKMSMKKPKPKLKDTAEWESYPKKISVKKPSSVTAYTYKDYTLYKRVTHKYGKKKTTIHFFSKDKPDQAHPSPLPDGYQIAVNKKTGIPYLKKKR
jgi:hypothetical protein